MLRRAGSQQHGAEASRVVQAQSTAIAEQDVDVVMLAWRRVSVDHGQTAGHAQVQQHVRVAQTDQDVLATPRQRHHHPTSQLRIKGVRHWPA